MVALPKPPRKAYHDRQWAEKMESLGLMLSSTGAAGGERVGYRMSHYIIPCGAFERAFEAMPAECRLPRLQAWMGHKRIDETMLYVHVAENHRREIPDDIVMAAHGEHEPDRRVLKMLGGSHVAAETLSTERTSLLTAV